MRKRIGIYGATDEVLALIPLLEANPAIEIAAVVDPAAPALLERLPHLDPELAGALEQTLGSDPGALTGDLRLHGIIDSGIGVPFAERWPDVVERGLQVVSPLTARLLWGLGAPGADRQSELLHVLREVVDSYNLTVDIDELFLRMLEIAIGVTSAEGGSLMLLDEATRELSVQVAVGVEPELWPKIRVRLGEGIAGKVAAEGRSLRLRGVADRARFKIVRERTDVESALSVPMIHEGRVLGVLNLHHGSRADAFSPADLAFTEELAHLDAAIIARAQEHASLRSQAARFAAVREVQRRMGGSAPLAERLRAVCDYVAEHSGGGIAMLYQLDGASGALRLSASSLPGGGLGSGTRIAPGQGLDGQVAQTGSPLFLRGPGGAIAYAALPLQAGERLAGVLSVQSGAGAPRGRAAEEMLLEIAACVAEAVVSAERASEMAARADVASAINEAGIRMISATELAEVLRLGTSKAAMVLEADHAVLRLQDEDTRRYTIRSYFGSADGPLQEALFRLDKDVSVDLLRRRAPLRIDDLGADARLAQHRAEVRSCLAAPLLREGRLIGTLALYDRAGAEREAGAFDAADEERFASFLSYLERAIANAVFHERAQRYRNFDEDTGLPNQSYLLQRIREEIARTAHREGGLALAVVRIENLREVEQASDPVKASRVVQRLVESLRSHARDFDVVGRCDRHEFAVLMPEPGHDPGRRVLDLSRAVAEDVSKDEALNSPIRIALGFGYSVHPADGRDGEALLAKAREPRIHMV